MLLKLRLLRSQDIFWNHGLWSQKEEISRSTPSTSTSALPLVMEVLELHPFSSNFVPLPLVVVSFSFIGLASVQVPSTILLGYSAAHECSETNILFEAEPMGSIRFSPLWLLRRGKWAQNFIAFCMHKWNITPQFALHVTTGCKC